MVNEGEGLYDEGLDMSQPREIEIRLHKTYDTVSFSKGLYKSQTSDFIREYSEKVDMINVKACHV